MLNTATKEFKFFDPPSFVATQKPTGAYGITVAEDGSVSWAEDIAAGITNRAAIMYTAHQNDPSETYKYMVNILTGLLKRGSKALGTSQDLRNGIIGYWDSWKTHIPRSGTWERHLCVSLNLSNRNNPRGVSGGACSRA